MFVTAVGGLSVSIIPDFLAWWPVWLSLVVLIGFMRARNLGRVRLSGLMALVATVVLAVFVAGHVIGWAAMPSAAQVLAGPAVGSERTAALSARINGRIELSSGGSQFLYRVDPIRQGGEVGLPSAVEEVRDADISVVLEPPADPGFYRYAGWEIMLSTSPDWDLTLEGELDADLTRLRVVGLEAVGTGELALGRVSTLVTAAIDGTFQVSVPPAQAVRVIGLATVPTSWTTDADGFVAPAGGDGWVITVESGSSVTVIER